LEGEIKESMLVYAKPPTLLTHLKRSLRRICLVYVNPFKLFDEVSRSPDFLGPVIVVSLVIVISLYEGFLWYSKAEILYYNGTKVSLSSGYISQLTSIASLRILGVVMRWFIAFGVFWLVSSILKGQGEHASLFSATGYLFSVYLLHMIIDTLHLVFFLSSMPSLTIFITYSASCTTKIKDLIVAHAVAQWISNAPWPMSTIRTYYAWFFSLWNIVVCLAIYISERKMTPIRAIIASLITYFLMMFAEVLFVQPLFI